MRKLHFGISSAIEDFNEFNGKAQFCIALAVRQHALIFFTVALKQAERLPEQIRARK
jgi:hypothetical protein